MWTMAQNDNREDQRKMTCTADVQAAFILSSFMTFFSGLLMLFISRLMWRSIKKWQNIKGTGILLVSFLIWDPTVWRSETGLTCVCVYKTIKASLSFHRLMEPATLIWCLRKGLIQLGGEQQAPRMLSQGLRYRARPPLLLLGGEMSGMADDEWKQRSLFKKKTPQTLCLCLYFEF